MILNRLCVAWFLIATTTTALSAAAQETGSSKFDDAPVPPVKRIVLYNSGVGQLQHEGSLIENKRVTLKFSSHDVSDVLKSLAISDDGGGHVRAIEYQPAPDPEDIAANDIGQPMTIAQLLQSMRGETVVLTKDDNSISGTIYGVENRTQGDVMREMVVLIGEKGLSSHELSQFDSIGFAKPELNEKLALALRGIVKSRLSNQKELQLLFEGDKERNVKFAYVVDMPIWRMTYRLLLEKEKAYLQGWAHVDNVSGVDWAEVDLELRSGKPMTFHTNVFAPVLAQRSDIGTSAYEFMDGLSVVTQWFGFPPAPRFDSGSSGGSQGGYFGGGGGFVGGMGGGGMGGGGFFGRGRSGEGDEEDGVDAREGFENAAETQKISQMVVYRIADPVSLGSGKSAALPAFEMELPGKLLSIADMLNRGDVTPVQSIELENDTEFSLLSGPVSIMRKGSFAGDGKLPRVDVKQKAYVNFGIDRPVRIKKEDSDIHEKLLKVAVNGTKILHTYRKSRVLNFSVVNLDDEDRAVLIKTARENEKETSIEPKPYRSTDDRLIFEVAAKAGATSKLAVTLSYVDVSSSSWTQLRTVDTKKWDDAGLSLPAADLALMRKVAELNRKIDRERDRSFVWLQKRKDAETEQKRIRDNLMVFVPGSKDAEPIIAQFVELEKLIGKCDVKIESSKEAKTDLEAAKNDLLK